MSTSAEPRPALGARVAAFCTEVVRPHAAAMAAGPDRFPRELFEEAASRGLLGVLVPREHGGSAEGHVAFARLIEAVARECASTAVMLDVHMSVASEPLVMFGTPEQRARILPRLATGEWLGAFALSESGSGSDAGSLQARAERVAGGYRLTGAKMWITNAGAADLYTVMARTGDRGPRGVTAFLVEASREGVRPSPPLHKLGLRGSWTAELVLDGVEVPEEARLGDEGQGFAVAMAALDSGRIGISAQATGIAQGALDAAVDRCRRDGLGAALDDDTAGAANLPATLALLAGMEARTAAARALTLHAAALVDAGQPVTRDAAVAKLVATDTAVEVAHTAVEICAPESAAELHPASVRLRDAKACQIYEGTNQVQRMVIARQLLRG